MNAIRLHGVNYFLVMSAYLFIIHTDTLNDGKPDGFVYYDYGSLVSLSKNITVGYFRTAMLRLSNACRRSVHITIKMH